MDSYILYCMTVENFNLNNTCSMTIEQIMQENSNLREKINELECEAIENEKYISLANANKNLWEFAMMEFLKDTGFPIHIIPTIAKDLIEAYIEIGASLDFLTFLSNLQIYKDPEPIVEKYYNEICDSLYTMCTMHKDDREKFGVGDRSPQYPNLSSIDQAIFETFMEIGILVLFYDGFIIVAHMDNLHL